jgi:hypothetical protein
MPKENSRKQKNNFSSKTHIRTKTVAQKSKSKIPSPLNKNDSVRYKTKSRKTTKSSAKLKKTIPTVKIDSPHYLEAKFNSESILKSKFSSSEKIVTFMKEKNSALMKEIQEQIIKTITIEEQYAILHLQYKNIEDLHLALIEEKKKLETENISFRQTVENDKNNIKSLVQQVNFLKYELDHLRSSNHRLGLTIRNQDSVIENEKKTRQHLKNTVVELNHAINNHCTKRLK